MNPFSVLPATLAAVAGKLNLTTVVPGVGWGDLSRPGQEHIRLWESG